MDNRRQILTTGLIQVANSKVFCKLGNDTIRDLTQDTAYVHPESKQCDYSPDLSNIDAALLNGMSASQIIAKATSSTSIKTEWFAGTLETGRHEEWTSDHTFSFVPTMFVGSEWHDSASIYNPDYIDCRDNAFHVILVQMSTIGYTLLTNLRVRLNGATIETWWSGSGSNHSIAGYALRF